MSCCAPCQAGALLARRDSYGSTAPGPRTRPVTQSPDQLPSHPGSNHLVSDPVTPPRTQSHGKLASHPVTRPITQSPGQSPSLPASHPPSPIHKLVSTRKKPTNELRTQTALVTGSRPAVGFEAAATLILVLNNQRQIEVFFTDYIPAMPAHCHEGRS